MVGTIVPVVHGDRRKRRPGPAVAHLAGSAAGGAAVGATAAALGSVSLGRLGDARLDATALVVAGGVALVLASAEAGLVNVPAPQIRRQVSQRWRRHLPPSLTALAFGVELGGGVTTFVPVTTFYVLLLGACLLADPAQGAAVMAVFGAARALPVLWIAASTADARGPRRVVDSLLGWDPLVHFANGLVLAATGAYLLGSIVSGR